MCTFPFITCILVSGFGFTTNGDLMNSIQTEIIDYLTLVYTNSDLPLTFAEDKFHKAFQWMKMQSYTMEIWNRENGSSPELKATFATWLEGQKN